VPLLFFLSMTHGISAAYIYVGEVQLILLFLYAY
jgi:hypothetical protein